MYVVNPIKSGDCKELYLPKGTSNTHVVGLFRFVTHVLCGVQ